MSDLTFRKQNSRNTSDHGCSVKDSSNKSQKIRAGTLQWCPKSNYLPVTEWNWLVERGSGTAALCGGRNKWRNPLKTAEDASVYSGHIATAAPGEVEAGPAPGHRAWQCPHPQKQESQQNKRDQRTGAFLRMTQGNSFCSGSLVLLHRAHWNSVSRRCLVQK